MSSIIKEEKQIPLFPGFTREQIELIKDTVCKGASDDELKLFLYTCKRTGLDPMMKQIYSIPRGGMRTTQTSIDGFRAIAERTGKYAPGQATQFTYDKDGALLSATAFIKKLTLDGTWHEISATIFWKEFVNFGNKFHKTMPHVMAAKTAEAAALRRAFPMEFSGLYATEEMVNGLAPSVSPEETQGLIDVKPMMEDEIILEIPKDIDESEVSLYFNFLSDLYKKDIPRLKKSALKNLEGFWQSFYKWKNKEEECPA